MPGQLLLRWLGTATIEAFSGFAALPIPLSYFCLVAMLCPQRQFHPLQMATEAL